jgi:hypothetical protein
MMHIVGRPSSNLLLDLPNPSAFSRLSCLYPLNMAYSDKWDGLREHGWKTSLAAYFKCGIV